MKHIRPLPELRGYRERQHPPLSQRELADKLGVTRATVCRWEAGKRRPDDQHIPTVAKMTGIPILELMGMRE